MHAMVRQATLIKSSRLYRKQYDSAGQLMVDYQKPMFAPDPDVDPSQLSDEERFAAENEGAMHNHDYRQLSSYWDEHGCLIIKARLTAEQGRCGNESHGYGNGRVEVGRTFRQLHNRHC